MDEVLKRAEELGASFADVRVETVKSLVIVANEVREYVSVNSVESGSFLRVLYEGNWGNASFPREPKPEDVDLALRTAVGSGNAAVVYLNQKTDRVRVTMSPNPEDFSIEDKMKILRKVRDEVLKLEGVKSVTVAYREELVTKEYFSTDPRDIRQEYGFNGFYVVATVRRGDVNLTVNERVYSYKRYVLEAEAERVIESMKRKVKEKLESVPPRQGKFPVVLSPEVTGVFAHEAVGHLSEADLAVSGIFRDKVGKQIASPLVSISDTPFIDQEQAIGITIYDDEGVDARKAEIIKNGVLNEFLNDRYYAAYLGRRTTGNARAEGPSSMPLIRMRNTHFEPGDSTAEELIREVREGYLLVSMSGGQTDSDGTFQFGIDEAYEIRDGEVGKPVTFLAITGNTLDALKRVSGVSKDFVFSPGFCGKGGQTVPVSDGGPYVRIDGILVGGYA